MAPLSVTAASCSILLLTAVALSWAIVVVRVLAALDGVSSSCLWPIEGTDVVTQKASAGFKHSSAARPSAMAGKISDAVDAITLPNVMQGWCTMCYSLSTALLCLLYMYLAGKSWSAAGRVRAQTSNRRLRRVFLRFPYQPPGCFIY